MLAPPFNSLQFDPAPHRSEPHVTRWVWWHFERWQRQCPLCGKEMPLSPHILLSVSTYICATAPVHFSHFYPFGSCTLSSCSFSLILVLYSISFLSKLTCFFSTLCPILIGVLQIISYSCHCEIHITIFVERTWSWWVRVYHPPLVIIACLMTSTYVNTHHVHRDGQGCSRYGTPSSAVFWLFIF